MGGRGRVGDRYHASPRRPYTAEPFPTLGYVARLTDIEMEHGRVPCERDSEAGDLNVGTGQMKVERKVVESL